MARRSGESPSAPFVSWVAEPAVQPSGPVRTRRRALARRFEGYSWLDAFIAVIVVAVVDLISLLIVSGWQSATCGLSCGLRTQLHLVHVALAWMLVVVIPLPVLISLLARKVRIAVAIVQALLCLGVLINAVSTEHRLVTRINGTAHCWNILYSDANCPWGPKD